jgi:autotransporter-associated beta strand protein
LLGAGNYLLSGTVKNNSATLITGLVQSGGGTTTLSGTNHSYSGPTSITAGKIALAAGATLANSTPIDLTGGTFDVSAIVGGWTLGATQTLSGTSNVVGAIIANGTVSPATAAVGNLSFGSNLTMNVASTYAVSVAADGLTNDKVLVTGNLVANGTINVSLNGYVPTAGYQIDIADAAAISGTPTVTGDPLTAGLAWDISNFTTTGIIKVVATGGGNPYASWATSNGLTGANNGATQDPDFDSVSNLVEFVLGGQPNPANPTSNSTGLLPVATTPGGNLVFTFTRDAQSKITQVALTIQVGTDLVTFPDIYTVGNGIVPSSPGVSITPSGGNDIITLTIPRSPDTKKFARLNAVYTP